MADGGKVIIKIDADTKGYYDKTGKLDKITTKALKGIATGAAAVASSMVAIGAAAVKSYADYEQLVGGVDTLFKESSKKLQEYANEAYKTAGMSANDYMQNVTSFSASLLSALGGDTEKAADVANMAMIDMSDNANKMGSSMESITMAYQGFAKQQYQLLDNLKLGYGGTKTEMERLLKDARAITGIKYDINNLSDVYNAIHVIQTELGITGTTAKEAASTITGSINMAKAAWQNLLVGIADPSQDLDKLVENLITSVQAVANNVIPRIKAVAKELTSLLISKMPEGFKMAVSAITAFGTALLAVKISLVVNDIANLVKGVKGFTTATELGAKAQALLNTQILANPYALAASLLAALVAGVAVYAATHKSAANEIRKSYEEEIKAIDDAQKSELAQAETADYLRNKLFELERQVNNGASTDEEATKIKNEFNGVANQLNEIIPGIISNIYDENGAISIQVDKVNALTNSYIALTKAKAMAAAYEKKITTAAESLIELRENEENLLKKGAGTPRKANSIFSLFAQYGEDDELIRTRELIKNTEEEMNAYISEMSKYTAEITELMGDAGDDSGQKFYQGIKKGLAKATKATKKGTDEQEKLLKKELRDLQFLRDTDAISEQEYYRKLAEYRDKYFEVGTEEWQQYTKEIYLYNKKAQEKMLDDAEKGADNIASAIKKRIESINDAKNSMQNSLHELADGFTTITFKGLGEKGEDITETFLSPSEQKKANDAKEEYAENLRKARERIYQALGEEDTAIAEKLYGEIISKGAGEGAAFAKAINIASENTFKEWLSERKRGYSLDASVAEGIYKPELDKVNEQIKESLDEVPEDLYGIGSDSAAKFGQGFIEEIRKRKDELKAEINALMADLFPTYGAAGNTSVTNSTYSPTYNILARGEGPQSFTRAMRDFEMQKKMTGGY